MNANSDARYEKLMAPWPQRRAKVEDFVDFLVRKEARAATLNRLLAIASALETAGMPCVTEEETSAEVNAVRAKRRTCQTAPSLSRSANNVFSGHAAAAEIVGPAPPA